MTTLDFFAKRHSLTNALGIVVGAGGTLTNIGLDYSRDGLYVKCYCDLNANGVYDADWDLLKVVEVPRRHASTITFVFQDGDSDRDGMPDVWEWHHGLCMTNAADAFVDSDGDGLINLHEFWAGCDPQTPDGSNTVLSVMARSVDALLTTNVVGRIDKFSVYNEILNTNCWAYPINTSCASAYNSCLYKHMAGTAISPRHIALASHYVISNRCTIAFVGTNETVVTRQVIDGKQVLATDIYIALLDDALPGIIKPASILPSNYHAYIRTGVGLPLLMFDASEHAIVTDLSNLPAAEGDVDGRKPVDPVRRLYFENVVSGDSGDPKFLVVNQDVILVSTVRSYGTDDSGIGPSYQSYAEDVQAVMDELSDRNSKPRESIQYFDFSPYLEIGD